MNHKQKIKCMPRLLTLFLICLMCASQAGAIESTYLTDSIRQGIGDIHLFKNISAAALESYRLEEGGNQIFFAVDINENASGSEKATTQGVAIKSAKLVVTIGGTTKEFTEFSTETQAVLIENTGLPGTLPQSYYTLLGGSGSSRITGSKTIINEFDSILTIHNVNQVLSSATDAKLVVTLLVTNVALGDPEAFYDFTNGFEDMAIFTKADAQELSDVIAPGRDEAPTVILTDPPVDTTAVTVSSLQFPSSGGFFWVAFEDLFPEKGDYDFNDLVVPYQVWFSLNDQGAVVNITGIAYLLARGAGFDHDWHLRIELPAGATGELFRTLEFPPETTLHPEAYLPEPFTGVIDVLGFEGTREIFADPNLDPEGDPESIYVNTIADRPFYKGPRVTFRAEFSTPVPVADIASAPFDPYLVVNDSISSGRKYEIHLIGKTPVLGADSRNILEGITAFEDANGYPFAMLIPEDWQFPLERVDLGVAYPRFINFVQTAGATNTDWYLFPQTAQVRIFNRTAWLWNPLVD